MVWREQTDVARPQCFLGHFEPNLVHEERFTRFCLLQMLNPQMRRIAGGVGVKLEAVLRAAAGVLDNHVEGIAIQPRCGIVIEVWERLGENLIRRAKLGRWHWFRTCRQYEYDKQQGPPKGGMAFKARST